MYKHKIERRIKGLRNDIKHPLKYARIMTENKCHERANSHILEAHGIARELNELRDKMVLAPRKVESLLDDGIFWGVYDPQDTDELQVLAAQRGARVEFDEFDADEVTIIRGDKIAIASLV